MGKIVKYCAACEESFAEKFAFCPNCAQPMTAFEMNPVAAPPAPPVVEEAKAAPIVDEPVYQTSEPTAYKIEPPIEAAPLIADDFDLLELPATADVEVAETNFSAETVSNKADIIADAITEDVKAEEPSPVSAEDVKAEEPPPVTKTFAAAAGASGGGNFHRTANPAYQTPAATAENADDVFSVTVIEEKNGKQRNLLLLGSMVVILSLAFGGTVYSLFNKEMGIGAIDGGDLFAAVVVEDVPVEIEEQPKPKDKDDGGGGGGGGREEPEPASKGRLVSQSENPIFPPNAKLPQLTNPDIKIIQETQGTIKRPITEERAGLPGSDNLNPSNGTGRGGGIGSGNGTGIGGGNGTGEGNGNGSGSGNGDGNGNGNGRGDGSGGGNPPPPPPVVREVVTVPFRIISKPRPGYTDAARQNQVTGVVRLKVTFLASGAIGSIAPVSGLPYGLTEQAISAARQIKFEPQKKNGAAVAVTKTIEYSFSIY